MRAAVVLALILAFAGCQSGRQGPDEDGSADLLGSLTAGDWAVIDIIEVDEVRQQVYFTGGGREPGRDPYLRHLYRVSFDPASAEAGKVTLLTPNDADHHFDPDSALHMQRLSGSIWPDSPIRPELGVFLDTYSTVDRAPVTVLRSTEDGELLAEVEDADTSALFKAGYTPPERRGFTAADGETEVYSVYYAPQRKVEGGRHPVIDAVYGGPQVSVAPRNFVQAVAALNPLAEAALARLGFAVVVTDARGTPGRSSAFRDAGYPEFTRVGIEDHTPTAAGSGPGPTRLPRTGRPSTSPEWPGTSRGGSFSSTATWT